MSNPFVAYLNSLHNEQASNQNAIAEMQIQSEYFKRTQVKRELITFLSDRLRDGCFVVLTGHAGDGKTTLLAQVLDELGVSCGSLKKQDTVQGEVSLMYVKDFSELTTGEQDEVLRKCFERQGASLLVANTGPLLAAVKRLAEDAEYMETVMLEAMDAPAGGEISMGGYGDAFVLNIARVDNTDFIRPFLKNIIDDDLWSPCGDCRRRQLCPMYFNRQLLKENFGRASTFIENAYIWHQEYDDRTTIRQITAHLTYAMTGGVSCEAVQTQAVPLWRYYYLFSNLLWGSRGTKENADAQQIRGVRLMNESRFDRRTTSVDYDLFVKDDVDPYYPERLRAMFHEVAHSIRPIGAVKRQSVLKRAYLLFGQNTPEKDETVLKETFSEWFPRYLDGRNDGGKLGNKEKTAICRAINTLFVGETYDEDDASIHLTLRRTNEQTANVQLLNGRIMEDDISLRFEPIPSVSKQRKLHQLVLNVGGKVRFVVGLPLLNYFCEIRNGVIITDLDPMLSNGIDGLKAQLLSKFSKSCEKGEVSVLYLRGTQWRRRKLMISNHRIDHD